MPPAQKMTLYQLNRINMLHNPSQKALYLIKFDVSITPYIVLKWCNFYAPLKCGWPANNFSLHPPYQKCQMSSFQHSHLHTSFFSRSSCSSLFEDKVNRQYSLPLIMHVHKYRKKKTKLPACCTVYRSRVGVLYMFFSKNSIVRAFFRPSISMLWIPSSPCRRCCQ